MCDRPVQRYSTTGRRSLIAMVARDAIRRVNGSATVFLVKPFIVMAARVLGPGRTRLRLVKLAHNLDTRGVVITPRQGFGDAQKPAVQSTKRAA